MAAYIEDKNSPTEKYPPKATLRVLWDELQRLADHPEPIRVRRLPDGGLSLSYGDENPVRRRWWQR